MARRKVKKFRRWDRVALTTYKAINYYGVRIELPVGEKGTVTRVLLPSVGPKSPKLLVSWDKGGSSSIAPKYLKSLDVLERLAEI